MHIRFEPPHALSDVIFANEQGPLPISSGPCSFDVQIRRQVQLMGHRTAVFLALAHALGQQVLDLPVHRAEIVLRPGGDGRVETGRQPQRDLLFLPGHLSTNCPS